MSNTAVAGEKCHTDFGVFTWKYACSCCSQVLCDNCAPQRVKTGGERICDTCCRKGLAGALFKGVVIESVGVEELQDAAASPGESEPRLAQRSNSDSFLRMDGNKEKTRIATTSHVELEGRLEEAEKRAHEAETRAETAEAKLAVYESSSFFESAAKRANEAEEKVAELERKLRAVQEQLAERCA